MVWTGVKYLTKRECQGKIREEGHEQGESTGLEKGIEREGIH